MLSKLKEAGVSWVIIGSQTKPYRPPTIEAVEEIVRACDKAGVPVFLKNNLKPLLTTRNAPWAYEEVPQGDHPNCEFELEYRQELPK